MFLLKMPSFQTLLRNSGVGEAILIEVGSEMYEVNSDGVKLGLESRFPYYKVLLGRRFEGLISQ